MPSGWMVASGGVRSNQRYKAKWTYCWSTSNGGRCRCAGGTSVKSREIDWENGYENQSPVFSYERSPNHIQPSKQQLFLPACWLQLGPCLLHFRHQSFVTIILSRCHNQFSMTTQIPWPFPNFVPFPWLFVEFYDILFPGFQKGWGYIYDEP